MTKLKRFVSALLVSCMMFSVLMMNAGAINNSDRKIYASEYEAAIINAYAKHGIEIEIAEHGKEWITQEELNDALNSIEKSANEFTLPTQVSTDDAETTSMATSSVNTNISPCVMPMYFSYVKTYPVKSDIPAGSCEFDVHFDGKLDIQGNNIMSMSDVQVTNRHGVAFDSYKITNKIVKKDKNFVSYEIMIEVLFKHTEKYTGAVITNNVATQFTEFLIDTNDYVL